MNIFAWLAKCTLVMANNGNHRAQLKSSATQTSLCQFADLLDLYFGLSCNRYKELRGSGFPLEPVASEARILIPALLVHSTSILALSKVYLSIHLSIHPYICSSVSCADHCSSVTEKEPTRPHSPWKKLLIPPSALWLWRKGWFQPNHNERPFISTWASFSMSMSNSSSCSADEASLPLLAPPNPKLPAVKADPLSTCTRSFSLCKVPACGDVEIITNDYYTFWDFWFVYRRHFVSVLLFVCVSYAALGLVFVMHQPKIKKACKPRGFSMIAGGHGSCEQHPNK